MVPSSADIVFQNRRISQSETSTISTCDVVNTIWRCMRGLAAMKMSLRQYFRLPRHLDTSQRTNHGMRSDANSLYGRRCITKSTNQVSCQADGF